MNGVDRKGNWATVTNTRGGGYRADKSRGGLPTGFLLHQGASEDYFEAVLDEGELYNGFNLLAGSVDELLFCTNARGRVQHLKPGIFTLSNDSLDTPWPKSPLAGYGFGHRDGAQPVIPVYCRPQLWHALHHGSID